MCVLDEFAKLDKKFSVSQQFSHPIFQTVTHNYPKFRLKRRTAISLDTNFRTISKTKNKKLQCNTCRLTPFHCTFAPRFFARFLLPKSCTKLVNQDSNSLEREMRRKRGTHQTGLREREKGRERKKKNKHRKGRNLHWNRSSQSGGRKKVQSSCNDSRMGK